MKNQNNNSRQLPPDIVECVLKSAYNGAASLLGHDRKDANNEVAAITLAKYIVQIQELARVIKNPRSWAYRVGRNEANSWVIHEARNISLGTSPYGIERDVDEALVHPESMTEDTYRGKEDILEALPELFAWFQDRIVNQLSDEDRLFYQRFYVDRWTEVQIASELNISQKAVAQRWRRMLVRMRSNLVNELPRWKNGNDLFGEAFKDPKSLGDLLCLIRMFVQEGFEAIRGIVEMLDGK